MLLAALLKLFSQTMSNYVKFIPALISFSVDLGAYTHTRELNSIVSNLSVPQES